MGYELHQQAADEVGGNLLGGTGEERMGEGWKVLDGRCGYGAGLAEEVLQDAGGAGHIG